MATYQAFLFLLFLTTSAASSSPPTTTPPPPPFPSPLLPSPPPFPPPPSQSPPPTPSPQPLSQPPQPRPSRRPKTPSKPSSPPPPPPPPPPPLSTQQINNIVDALIGSGDFTNWASIISMINPMSLPLSATLFVPQDNSINNLPNFDPLILPYHIVPQRLSFSQLQLFNTKTRLPTLLPGKSILISNNSRSNFTLDASKIIHPDLYATNSLTLHGIEAVLDYSLYGDGLDLLPKSPPLPQPQPPQQPEIVITPPIPIPIPTFLPDNGGQVIDWISHASCSCTQDDLPVIIFLVIVLFLRF